MEQNSWPLISIVTPSFNQAKFLEETILSIKSQNYSRIEHIVIDGGSSDESCSILEKYSDCLKYWVSEPDNGQAHAINKGLEHCSGDIFNWINSDDVLLPGALKMIAEAWQLYPDHIIAGDTLINDSNKGQSYFMKNRGIELRNMIEIWDGKQMNWCQPGTFLPMKLICRIGSLDENLRYAFDRDLMCRALKSTKVFYLNSPVATFRLHSESKSVKEAVHWSSEQALVSIRYGAGTQGFNESIAKAECKLCWSILPMLFSRSHKPQKTSALIGLIELVWNYPTIIKSRRFYMAIVLLFMPSRWASKVYEKYDRRKVSK